MLNGDKLPGSDLLRLAAQALLGRAGWDGPLEDCKRVDVCVWWFRLWLS